ncbi:IS5 family transposase [Xanthomonas bonasiae]|uniref:IS5 family transposase n=1 Tax=Xanthomonas bonasiae TaxID=2810351 RepID=UPI00177D2406|nr:IS5 family transposase [Xanthomonas surreyensis]MBD7924774.1 IS5 family transposase [Xanthomonas surreyensis]
MISLFAGHERESKRQQIGDPLSVLSRHIDFVAIAQAVDAKLSLNTGTRGGRPAWPTVVMVKLLLLQQLYNLSDDALEYQVLDRRSFQQFLGLEHSGKVPDAKTIWVWRERLKAKDVMGDISAAISQQLQRAGFVARGGQIIDASIVSAPIQRNTREENAQIKQGEDVGQDWSDAKRAQKDVQARWTRKHGVAFYGYKLHASTDRRWGFIRRYDVSAANVHDSRHFEQVLDPDNTGRTVWADSGYADAGREAALRQRGYHPAIQHQGQARKPLSEREKRRNHRIAKDRVFGEHPFARLAQQGGKCLRCIGLARATVVIGLKVASHNLLRLARLQDRALLPA